MGPLTIDFLVEVSSFISETVSCNIVSPISRCQRSIFEVSKTKPAKKSDMLAQCFLHSHIGSFSSLKNHA